ncbi:hypothetical protein I4U23_001400 [Adineta vaga]|nr:hypothetical protein I4U23_001400 [Adineta vaga]
MVNLEKQSDEIFALKSIFDKNFHHLDENQYEILIDFDLLTPLTIEYEDQTSTIEYLPPFSLLIHYHDEYPSTDPPSFILSCFYFSKYKLRKLCQKLDHYQFIPEEVCVYDWIDLIKLEINNKLILQNNEDDDDDNDDDPRAINGYTNETVGKIFQYLIHYNSEQFHKRIQICLICNNSIRGVDCIRLERCQHFYCQLCLQNYVQMTLNNGQFGEQIHCPQNQCQRALLPTEIQRILQNDQLYERYERITLQHSLESMDDIIWCPRCQSPVLIDKSNDNLTMCDQCRYIFCKKCKQIFHSQTICPKDYLRQQLEHVSLSMNDMNFTQGLQRKQELGREHTLATLAKIDRKNRALIEENLATQKYQQIIMKQSDQHALLEEILNAERIELLNTQPCPRCHVQIEKNGGCSHMHCSRCKHDFTWDTRVAPVTSRNISLLYKYIRKSEQIDSLQGELNQTQNTENGRISIDNRSAMGSAIINRVKQCPTRSLDVEDNSVFYVDIESWFTTF